MKISQWNKRLETKLQDCLATKTKASKIEQLEFLKDDIHAMKMEGMSWYDIMDVLSHAGLAVSDATFLRFSKAQGWASKKKQ